MQIEIQNAVTIEAETLGEQENPLVLLVSGAGAPSSFWPFRFREAIASSGFFVVSYCHRDTGCSTHFTSAYGIKDLLGNLEHGASPWRPDNPCRCATQGVQRLPAVSYCKDRVA